MLTFLLGLSLGTCIGAVVAGVCAAAYRERAQDHASAADNEELLPAPRYRAL